jgi:NADPH-dependent 2,4-dienoyl-CoA reductase/sulfur reductase-like enzyme
VSQDDRYQVKYHNIDGGEEKSNDFDGVVIGIGIKPNIDLAKTAGIEIDNGILVNKYLQTNFPDIFAAGDVSNFFNMGLRMRQRVEHEDNANSMGMRAGLNMSGSMEKYTHFPFFYSDLFDLGYEAIGELNKNYQIYSDWIDPFTKGTIYYLEDGKIRGLIFWNFWGKVDKGRQIIEEGKTYKISDLTNLFKDD